MRTVSNLLWPVGGKASSQNSTGPVPIQRSAEPAAKSDDAAPAAGADAGDDHEVLRRLLKDTSQQLHAIDGLKDNFGRLVEPLSNLLTTLEREKADNARSQDAFAEIRSSHETLRAQFQDLERKSFELERDNERLRREIESARRGGREFEDDRAKLTSEVAAVRIAMSVIVKQLGEETGNARVLSEEKGGLAKRVDAAEKRVAELEAQFTQAREQLSLLDSDKSTLRAALDKSLIESAHSSHRLAETERVLSSSRSRLQEVESRLAVAEAERNTTQAEASRLFRQLTESQNALSGSSSRLQQLETSLAAAEAERDRLAAARDEANERRQKDSHELRLELHELHARFKTAEEMLVDARRNLAARAEEAAAADAKLLEVTLARNEAERKLENLSAASESWQQQTQKLECEVANLTDRCKILSDTLATGEGSLVQANEKIRTLTAQFEQLQSDATKYRTRAEQIFAQLNASVEHERHERAQAEGALVRARNDYARLQRQIVEERSVRRSDHQRRVFGNNSAAS